MESEESKVFNLQNKLIYKKLKADLSAQCMFALTGMVTLFIFPFFGFGLIYFGLGFYQVFSAIFNIQFGPMSIGRKLYWPQLGFHALCFISLMFVDDTIGMLLIIWPATTFTAIYYLIVTAVEYQTFKHLYTNHYE
ncbi:MAG TPA: hypothetical protein VK177_02900 [Flavobacteriales bacterium]|nr:hypothetical protein [Flavobacteriales bacterium]